MLPRMSLRFRLNLAFAALLALGVLADVAVTIEGAGNRIAPEIQNATGLVGEIISTALRGMHEGSELTPQLHALARGLDKLRHVAVVFAPSESGAAISPAPTKGQGDRPPELFVALVRPEPYAFRIDAIVDGRSRGTFVVAADPMDEISELWDGVVALAIDGTAAAAVGFVLLYFVVRSSLKPLDTIGRGLTALGGGDFHVRLGTDVPAEFVGLVRGFNALGESLSAASRENQSLRSRLVSIQDEERRELARELHDEVGPHLFAARAHADAARRASPAAEAIDAVILSIDAIQNTNRRILNWLRPAALVELGLGEALSALRLFWARTRPEVKVAIEVQDDLPPIEERLEAALYRIAQEALTNAFRHSGADEICVSLRTNGAGELELTIADNGKGAAGAESGLGLLGIRERIAAYGGRMEWASPAPRGLALRTVFPLSP